MLAQEMLELFFIGTSSAMCRHQENRDAADRG
jgi:hypothetical protein